MEPGFLGAHGYFLITGLIMAAPAVQFVLEGLMAPALPCITSLIIIHRVDLVRRRPMEKEVAGQPLEDIACRRHEQPTADGGK